MDRLRETLHLVYFKDKIPLRPILQRLREAEEKLKSKEAREISREALLENLDKPVISLEELADRIRVTREALKEFLRDEEIPGYKLLPDLLIRGDKLREIGDSLKRRILDGRLSLNEASRIIEELGGIKPTAILEALGYRVVWRGIDPDAAEVEAEGKQ
jgi:transcriptional regulator with XRE-family HTH domain